MKEKEEKEQSEKPDAFDINKKVAEIPAEELDGFFHDIDLSEGSEKETKNEDQKGEQKKTEPIEEEDLKKSMLDGANFL